jgi:hypothetical protein
MGPRMSAMFGCVDALFIVEDEVGGKNEALVDGFDSEVKKMGLGEAVTVVPREKTLVLIDGMMGVAVRLALSHC